ncbi:peptidase domain-containing ABC transporter [Streptomyces phyllanthi]|uniref:Peptidase domain-containing ABC transporter n=1 Tax=Streptomyces phyllanthi TaxID=1803180 RepID=A0A5N8W7P4_9ACTN|nr:peptidase domain-containing ABC transporter [Streptomyces phyllanthi]MPY43132.1 peptidase domain-containing ABC transporter [Streptomyces phyllanthi]
MKGRIPQILQLTQTECGLCCVLMLLHFHGIKESLFSLRRQIEVGRDGVSLSQLRQILHTRGFETKLFRTNIPGMRGLKAPFIAYWESYHFVVVENVGRDFVTIVDPAVGRTRLPIQEFADSFSGIVLVATETANVVRAVTPQPSPWLNFLRPLLASKSLIGLILLLSTTLYGAVLGVPILTRRIVDAQLTGRLPSIEYLIVLALVLGALVYYLVSVSRVWITTRLSVRLGRIVMTDTFGRLLRLPYKFFSTRSPGELMYRLSSVNMIRDTVSAQLVGGVFDLGMLLFIAGYMLLESWELSLVALAFFGVIMATLILNRQGVGESVRNENTELSKSQSMQMEAVLSIVSLKLSGTEDRFLARWRKVYERSLTRLARRSLLQGRIDGVVAVIRVVAPLGILLYGMHLYRGGTISIGTVVAFQAISATFFSLASSVFGTYTQFLMVDSYLDRIQDIVHTDPEPDRAHGIKACLDGMLDVRGVGFSYTATSPQILQDVSFRAMPGQKIAIVGQSGCGKSTLGKILSGLYTPTSGEITYDGNLAEDYERKAFYGSFGYVPQEIILENKSVHENIAMDDEEITVADVEAAATAARIHEEIQQMPMGYNTLVSELGANFSGGQRQRIALARAFAKKPRVLVLDEATSSLDILNETRISDFLRTQECTSVVISHRLATIMDADEILVMKDGRIIERGTHEALCALNGHYCAMFESQLATVQ